MQHKVSRTSPLATLIARGCHALDAMPYAVLALLLRLALATVFLSSALAHVADWNTTEYLFAEEYRVPLLHPHTAAVLAVAIEFGASALLILGMMTRVAAAVLLMMTLIIEVFVYPAAWPTHLQWAAMLLVLLCRGPGSLSIDRLLLRMAAGSSGRRGAYTSTRSGL